MTMMHGIVTIGMTFILLTNAQSNYINKCLRYGCPMSGGIYAEDVNVKISELLPSSEHRDNVLKVVTYDLMQDVNSHQKTDKELCDYIKEMGPTVIGLQNVNRQQFNFLQNCLSNYQPTRSAYNGEAVIHPIFLKKSRRLNVIKSGSFKLSGGNKKNANSSNPGSCQWARVTFAKRESTPQQAFAFGFSSNSPTETNSLDKILRLLKLFTGQASQPKLSFTPRRSPPTVYRRFDFFVVSASLDTANDEIAAKQAHSLTKNLYKVLMDRRRYPVLILADLGFEDDSNVYNVFQNKPWLHNAFVKSKEVYPEMSFVKPNDFRRSLVDYIWYNRFQTLYSATLIDNRENHRPILAAMLPESD